MSPLAHLLKVAHPNSALRRKFPHGCTPADLDLDDARDERLTFERVALWETLDRAERVRTSPFELALDDAAEPLAA